MPELITTPVTLGGFAQVVPANRDLYLVVTGAGGEEGRVRVDAALQLLESVDLPEIPAENVTAALVSSSSDNAPEDNSELLYLDGEALKRGTLTGLISSIFKTDRTTANAQFAAASFKLFNAAGTPKALAFNTAALTADRVATFPDRDIDFGSVGQDLGRGQTWQDLTGSRVTGTSYQNTTGRAIAVSVAASVAGSTLGFLQVSTDGVTWVNAGFSVNDGSGGAIRAGASFTIVPPGHFYRWTTIAFTNWSELR